MKTFTTIAAVALFVIASSISTTEAFSSFSQIGANVQGTAGVPEKFLPPNSNSPEPKKASKSGSASISIAPTLTGGLVSDAAGRRHNNAQELPPNSQPKTEFFYPSRTTGTTKSFSMVHESKPNAKNIGFFFPPPKK